MRLRQVALVARHLEPGGDDLCAVLGIAIAVRDLAVMAFGLHNGAVPLGADSVVKCGTRLRLV